MIQKIIDDYLVQEQEKRSSRQRSGKISPSSLGQCYRRQYWNRLNEPMSNPFDNRTLRVFKAGDVFHDFVQEKILSLHPDWQVEVRAEQDDILGFADIVSPDEVSDLKTKHSKGFWWDKKEVEKGKDIAEMFYPNWLQVMTYSFILGKKQSRLVFISKDDLCIQEYHQPLDDYWLNEIDMELTKIRYYWDGKTLPPKTPRLYGGEKTKKECGYCVYKDKCDQTKGGEKC